jgi:hypothetical protein
MTNTAHNRLVQNQAAVIEKRIQSNEAVFFKRFPDIYRPKARKKTHFYKSRPVTTGTTPQQVELASNALGKGSKHTAHETLTDPSYPRAGDASGDAAGPVSLQTGIGSESDRWGRQPLAKVASSSAPQEAKA